MVLGANKLSAFVTNKLSCYYDSQKGGFHDWKATKDIFLKFLKFMVSLDNRGENSMWNIFLTLKGEKIMKKIITISITIILVTFLSLSNAVAEGRRYKNTEGTITGSDSRNHRYTYNKHDDSRNHKYTYNKNHNNRNHRYNMHNKRYDRRNHRYQHNKRYDRWNNGHTYHKSYNHRNHRYNRHNYRHDHRSNGYWTLHLIIPSLLFNL